MKTVVQVQKAVERKMLVGREENVDMRNGVSASLRYDENVFEVGSSHECRMGRSE